MQQVALFGGNANNGTNAGRFYWNLNNASSNANRNIGAHLAVVVTRYNTPTLKGKYGTPIQFSRDTEKLGGKQQ